MTSVLLDPWKFNDNGTKMEESDIGISTQMLNRCWIRPSAACSSVTWRRSAGVMKHVLSWIFHHSHLQLVTSVNIGIMKSLACGIGHVSYVTLSYHVSLFSLTFISFRWRRAVSVTTNKHSKAVSIYYRQIVQKEKRWVCS